MTEVPAPTQHQADTLAKDMLEIAHKYLGFATTKVQSDFVQELCIYIAKRDLQVAQHALEVGKR